MQERGVRNGALSGEAGQAVMFMSWEFEMGPRPVKAFMCMSRDCEMGCQSGEAGQAVMCMS